MKKIIYIAIIAITAFNLNAQDLPVFTEPTKLGSDVNTEADEVKPILNSDGSTMYFTRAHYKENEGYAKRVGDQDIWESTNTDGVWGAVLHEVTINDEWDNSIIGYGKGNSYFLLNTYQSKEKLEFGIAKTQKNGVNSWSKPESIKIPKLKFIGNFYDFYISHDEQILLISIKGEDSVGEEDLYVSQSKDGKWSEPISLGNTINTTGFEMSPFLTQDKKYLYFSTNGRKDGLGNADVYRSERLDDSWTKWSEPENLGENINSAAMDAYFTASDSGVYYFSSSRGGDNLDIYKANLEIPMITIAGNLYSASDSSKIMGTITLMNSKAENQLIVNDSAIALANNYMAKVLLNDTYSVSASSELYESSKIELDLATVKKGETVTQDIYLKPIAKEEEPVKEEVVKEEPKKEVVVEEVITKPIVLKRVLHPYDEAGHTGGTGINIDDVIKTMKDYPFMVIQVESHTDSKGSEEYNTELSKRRASSAKTYLIRNGISGSRIKVKWFGESQAVSPNTKPDGSDNPEGRAENRRTEFKIISNDKK